MPEVRCSQCPLRRLPLFIPNRTDEIALVQPLKQREMSVGPGELLIQEGQTEASLFTLLTGWAYRRAVCLSAWGHVGAAPPIPHHGFQCHLAERA